jgi:uncharacterized protein (TIGR03437 family)
LNQTWLTFDQQFVGPNGSEERWIEFESPSMINPYLYGSVDLKSDLLSRVGQTWGMRDDGSGLQNFGVGFGPTDPSVPAGRIFTGSAPTTSAPVVTIGGLRAEVLYSGMTGAGLCQFNIKVPTLPSGDQQVRISIAGVEAPPV